MKGKRARNRYCRYAKIGGRLFLRVLHEFALARSASATARKLPLSLRSVNSIYVRLRNRVIEHMQAQPDAFGGAGYFIGLATAYRRQRGEQWDPLDFPSEGCWWAFDSSLRGLAQRRLQQLYVPREHREAHETEILVREHLRKTFSGDADDPKAEMTNYLDTLRAIGDAIMDAKAQNDMENYLRLTTLMEQKRRATTSRRGELFYEHLRKHLLHQPLC